MQRRTDLRNIAIVAHVDHGKTTLVDALLRQSGAFAEREEPVERVLDSADLEREKGITILAKHTVVHREGLTITIVDTPGHADFGGEVERSLAMVDGVLLVVDAVEGPLPQTRFALDKALSRGLPVVVVVNKVDRPTARPQEVRHQVEDLFLELDAAADQLDFPVLYASGREGWATATPGAAGSDLQPLFSAVEEAVPGPLHDPEHPFQALVTNLDASPYLGRLAVCRVMHGRVARGDAVAWCHLDGVPSVAKVAALFTTEGLRRLEAEEAGPGEIVAVAGITEVAVGDTLAALDDPRPLRRLVVEEPRLAVTVGVNSSPLAGRDGNRLTARLVEGRLRGETVGNVSLEVLPTERADAFEVRGRGELQLAVLIETMRREGFELTVGKPQAVTRIVDDRVLEPMERVTLDVPEGHVGPVTQLLAARLARLVDMGTLGTGWARLEYRIPSRGLVGFRGELMIETRGAAQLHHVLDGWQPWQGELRRRRNGALVADRTGKATGYALMALQDRGALFVRPGDEVYEGMVVGASARGDDMDVNPTRERKLTNVRSSTAEELERLTPPRRFSLEQALEAIEPDEAVEVTPGALRLRKVVLDRAARARGRSHARREGRGAVPVAR